jgi:hypothetical protein
LLLALQLRPARAATTDECVVVDCEAVDQSCMLLRAKISATEPRPVTGFAQALAIECSRILRFKIADESTHGDAVFKWLAGAERDVDEIGPACPSVGEWSCTEQTSRPCVSVTVYDDDGLSGGDGRLQYMCTPMSVQLYVLQTSMYERYPIVVLLPSLVLLWVLWRCLCWCARRRQRGVLVKKMELRKRTH